MAATTLAGFSLTRFTHTAAFSCTDDCAATRHVQFRSALPPFKLRLERRQQVHRSFRAAQSEIFGGQVAREGRRRLVRGFGVQLSGTLIVCPYHVLMSGFSGKSRKFHNASVQLSSEQIDRCHATSEDQR